MHTIMHSIAAPRSRQSGSFLLEALIALLIVALGVLGSVGLLARSMQDIDDAKHRGEAAYLANQLISQMWLSDRLYVNLDTNFSSAVGTGVPYTDWLTSVQTRLPNANLFAQDVVVARGPNIPLNPALQSNSLVTITIRWQPPNERTATPPPPHQYSVTAAIGANQ